VPNILDRNDSIGAGAVLDDDIVELSRVGETAHHADGHLEGLFGIGGLLPELTGSDLYVLL
jgi:hypothetical protein